MRDSNKAIIIFGPPGAGKGTQARLIAGRLGLINFDTGRLIERIIYDPKFSKSAVVRRERKNFESGKLCTPSWVLELTKKAVKQIHAAGSGLVLQGSPRTFLEAFGQGKTKGLIDTLTKLYGKKNVLIFEIEIPPRQSLLRNSKRLVCSVCDTPLLRFYSHLKNCPFCGGRLLKRSLDKPEIIKVRIEEYKKRGAPIFSELKKRGFHIKKINGNPLPAQIFSKFRKIIESQ